jgi:hypothetical protein
MKLSESVGVGSRQKNETAWSYNSDHLTDKALTRLKSRDEFKYGNAYGQLKTIIIKRQSIVCRTMSE